MPRNRIIYQSEALYVGPSPAISGFFTGIGLGQVGVSGTAGFATRYSGVTGAAGIGRDRVNPTGNPDQENLIGQLHRIQTANYAFNISRTDINQFGELAAIDRVILDSPTVSLDFSYILANFENERRLGFVTDGSFTCIKNLINKNSDEKNYFIETVGEGRDAYQDATHGDTAVIGIGNGFITSYTSECSVGNLPTVSINVEALNMAFNNNISGQSPAISPQSGTRLGYNYVLPKATGSAGSGDLSTSALRPGDMVFHFKKVDAEGASSDELLVGADNSYDAPGAKLGNGVDDAFAKIQSYNISLDMGREAIQKLGSRFAFTREITFPITATCTIEALVADLTTGSLSDIINCDDSYDITINLLRPTNCYVTSGTSYQDIFVQYRLKNVKVNSQAFSSDIGSNKSVTIEFATQIGGPNQVRQGLFMSGYDIDGRAFTQDSSAQQ